MDDVENGKVAAEIIEGIKKNFPRARANSIKIDDDLFEKGIIDSLGFLTLVSFLEQNFQITIDDEDIVPENFISVQSMTKYILNKTNGWS